MHTFELGRSITQFTAIQADLDIIIDALCRPEGKSVLLTALCELGSPWSLVASTYSLFRKSVNKNDINSLVSIIQKSNSLYFIDLLLTSKADMVPVDTDPILIGFLFKHYLNKLPFQLFIEKESIEFAYGE